MNKEGITNREKLLSDGLMGRVSESNSSSKMSKDISSSLIAISTMALLVLSACSEAENVDSLGANDEDAVSQNSDSTIGSTPGTEPDPETDPELDVDIFPSYYLFHNDGIYALYMDKFPMPVSVSVSFEQEGELVVLEGVISKDGIFDLRGIPTEVKQATMHYGEQSFTFKKDVIKDAYEKELDETASN